PAYLGRGDERLRADEPLRIPAGTRLDITGRSSSPITSAVLVTESRAATLAANGLQFAGTLVPTTSDLWTWRVEGAAQAIEDLPPALDIDVIPDSLPRAEILAPTGVRMAAS